MGETLTPTTDREVRDAILWAAAEGVALAVEGRGTKRGLGHPVAARHRLELSALGGIVSYEPEELVLTARAGTPIAEIEAALEERRQMLAFEPMDPGPSLESPPAQGTIGGVLAANLSGPRRISAGAARDHFLGVKAVSGRGETFAAGGRVVKNVTGYDLCKLLAGSYGTLAVMTEVTLKVLPEAEDEGTLVVLGLADKAAIALLGAVSRKPFEVSGFAHLPAATAARAAAGPVRSAGQAVTAFRIEGTSAGVLERLQALSRATHPERQMQKLDRDTSRLLWRDIRDAGPLAEPRTRALWRLSLPPAMGAAVGREIAGEIAADLLYDWAGGRLWVAVEAAGDAAAPVVRRAVEKTGGHAMLFRAEDAIKRRVPVYEPRPSALAALEERVREGFDPRRILNPGRLSPIPEGV